MPFDIAKDVQAIKSAILKSRYVAARLANAEMLKLYFAIGAYVSRNSREGHWGTGAIDEISRLLQKELPGLRGFSATNMRNMRIFYEAWSSPMVIRQPLADKLCLVNLDQGFLPSSKAEIEIHQPLADELGTNDATAFMSIGFTSHMEIIFACKTPEERLFYIRKCAFEFWSKRVLLQHLKANDYATQGKEVNNFAVTMPDEKHVPRTIQAFKSEYLLDFVNIVDANDDEETLDEPEWMMEMVSKIRRFIQAVGSDFCFMDVKKRFIVDDEEYFADLVFFHRELKCMVAVELKRGAYLGQLEFYLACLDKYVKREDENPSIGLLLCHEMNRSVVELTIGRHNSPMGVATYRTAEDVPDQYKSLRPLLDGAQKILKEASLNGESEKDTATKQIGR
ncbi:MAG: DUF1016 family protein [Lentisphaeria bacterium]|nr:DUF1016 family protein [Lentisphaeria bacterium]